MFEAEIPEDDKRHLFHQTDLVRQCGNELLGIMKRRLEQLLRTKRYRGLQKYYGSLNEKLKALEKVKVLSAIQKKHRQELLAELKSVGDFMKEEDKLIFTIILRTHQISSIHNPVNRKGNRRCSAGGTLRGHRIIANMDFFCIILPYCKK